MGRGVGRIILTACQSLVLSFPILTHSFALFCTRQKRKPSVSKHFHTLAQKNTRGGVGISRKPLHFAAPPNCVFCVHRSSAKLERRRRATTHIAKPSAGLFLLADRGSRSTDHGSQTTDHGSQTTDHGLPRLGSLALLRGEPCAVLALAGRSTHYPLFTPRSLHVLWRNAG
jgi:hypothetical protein